jgi:hypothetical protein
MIFGLADSILLMLLCRWDNSGATRAVRRESLMGTSGGPNSFDGDMLTIFCSSFGHSHSSGGRQESECLYLVVIGHPCVGESCVFAFVKVVLGDVESIPPGTGKSNVDVG